MDATHSAPAQPSPDPRGAPYPAQPGPAPQGPAKPKKRRVLVWVLALLLPIVVIAAAAAIFHDPLLRYFVAREARDRGVAIAFDDWEIGDSWLRLYKARITLEGVDGFTADISKARISLTGGFIPRDVKKIDAQSIFIRVEGSAADRALELGEWVKQHPDAFRIPITASDVKVEWREQKGAAPWLSLADGSMAPVTSGVAFRAGVASVGGISVGPAGAVWTADASTISLGFGKETLADAPVRIDVRPKPLPATIDIVLRPVTMADLGSPMGLKLPTDKATIEGTVKLSLGERFDKDPISGTTSMTLRGWTPPHPRELGGIVFGDRTLFATDFKIAEDKKTVTLTNAAVAAGAFKLKGSGSIERKGAYARVLMDMAGSIPCTDIARSATASHLGSAAGAFAGDVAKLVMEGSVAVSVRIDADTRDLQNPKIQQGIGVGCGLRGLSGIPLPKFELPKLPTDLPKLPSPGELPTLPDLGL